MVIFGAWAATLENIRKMNRQDVRVYSRGVCWTVCCKPKVETAEPRESLNARFVPIHIVFFCLTKFNDSFDRFCSRCCTFALMLDSKRRSVTSECLFSR